jgi:hypothetical protein
MKVKDRHDLPNYIRRVYECQDTGKQKVTHEVSEKDFNELMMKKKVRASLVKENTCGERLDEIIKDHSLRISEMCRK